MNERFAQLHFENQATIGRRILLVDQDARSGAPTETRWMTIVAVVGNIRQRTLPSGDFDPVVYASYAAEPPRFVQIVARSVSGPAEAATFVREQMRHFDADLPVFGMATVDELLGSQQWIQRLFGSLFGSLRADCDAVGDVRSVHGDVVRRLTPDKGAWRASRSGCRRSQRLVVGDAGHSVANGFRTRGGNGWCHCRRDGAASVFGRDTWSEPGGVRGCRLHVGRCRPRGERRSCASRHQIGSGGGASGGLDDSSDLCPLLLRECRRTHSPHLNHGGLFLCAIVVPLTGVMNDVSPGGHGHRAVGIELLTRA